MPLNVDDIIDELTPAQHKKVEARAAQLIAEEMTLRQLRRARKLTQQKLAKSLHIGQEGVSKLEKRSDLLISTLRDYVQAMGGNLSLVAEFPDSGPVVLSSIAEDEPAPKPSGRRHAMYDRREWRRVEKHLTPTEVILKSKDLLRPRPVP
jgi:transcriptional regulator with XRE-family HTH domain